MNRVNLRLISFSILISLLPAYIVRFKVLGLPTTLLEITFLGVLAIWVFSLSLQRNSFGEITRRLDSPLVKPGLLFLLAAILAVFTSPNPYKGFGAFRALVLEPIILYFIILETGRLGDKTGFNQWIIKSLIFSGFLVSLYGLFQFVTKTNQIAPLEALQGRVTSFFNHPNFLALYLGPIIILILGQLLSCLLAEGKSQPLRNRIFQITLLSLFGLVFLLTKSRGGLLGLGVGMGSLIIFYLFKHFGIRVRKIIKITSLLLLSAIILGWFYLFFNISQYTPKNKLTWPRPDPQTSTIRLCVWEGTKNLLQDSAVFGSGLGGFVQIYPDYRTCDTEHFTYPHNLFLNFWTETGILGLASFSLIIFVLLKMLLNSGGNISLRASILGVLIYWFVHGLVDVPYFKNDLAYLFWIMAAIATIEFDSRRSRRS